MVTCRCRAWTDAQSFSCKRAPILARPRKKMQTDSMEKMLSQYGPWKDRYLQHIGWVMHGKPFANQNMNILNEVVWKKQFAY